MTQTHRPLDPERDLILERTIRAAPETLWAYWTQPAALERWFCPAPFRATQAVVELHPGGAFQFVIRGPDGYEHTHSCCILEADAPHRLVWTTALGRGYRPVTPDQGDAPPFFTAVITLEKAGDSTRYRAVAHHADAAGAAVHAKMGFQEGWGAALDQLVALVAPGKPG